MIKNANNITHIIIKAVVKNKNTKDKDWATVKKLIINAIINNPIENITFTIIIIIDFLI